MNQKEFDDGIKILTAAFRQKYSEDSYKLFWAELKEKNGDAFLTTCRILAKEETRLPSLSMIFARLPQEIVPEGLPRIVHELWSDKMRRLYNAVISLPTREERFAFTDRLDAPDRNALADAVLLYETIWPEVCRQNPMADSETKIRLALDQLINHDPRSKRGPKPAWYLKKYENAKPAPAVQEPTQVKFDLATLEGPGPAAGLHPEKIIVDDKVEKEPEFTEENLPF